MRQALSFEELLEQADRLSYQDPNAALGTLECAMSLSAADNGAGLIRVLKLRGQLLTMLGRFEAALDDLVRAQQLTIGCENPEQEAQLQCLIANIHILQGLYPDALSLLLDAQRILEQQQPAHPFKARILNSLGNVYHLLGEGDKASEQLQRSIDLARQSGNPLIECLALDSLANVNLANGKAAQALEHATCAIKLLRRLGRDDYLAEYLITLAQALESNGKDGMPCLDEALTLAQRLQLTRYVAQARYQRGLLANKNGDPAQAEQQLRMALTLSDQIGDSRLGYLACHALAMQLKAQARFREALDYYEMFHHRKENLLGATAALRVHYLEIRHRIARIEQQKAAALSRTQTLEQEVARRTQLQAQAERLAQIDSLTGIYNRRHFRDQAQQMLRACQQGGRRAALILLDADHFKQINDTWGHATGDLALKQISQTLLDTARHQDLFGRYGGEEFVILMPDTQTEHAQLATQRMLKRISLHGLPYGKLTLPLSLSAGVAAWQPGMSLDALVRNADTALYQAKAAGRNCSRVFASAHELPGPSGAGA